MKLFSIAEGTAAVIGILFIVHKVYLYVTSIVSKVQTKVAAVKKDL